MMYKEPTCLVAVIDDSVNLPSGSLKRPKESYSIRDVSKIRRAYESNNEEVSTRTASQLRKRQMRDLNGNRLAAFGFGNEASSINERGFNNGEEDEIAAARGLTMEELQMSMSTLAGGGSLDGTGMFSPNSTGKTGVAASMFNSGKIIRGKDGHAMRLSNGRVSRQNNLDSSMMDTQTYQELSRLEKEAMNDWIQGIRNMILPYEDILNLKYYDEMENYAIDLLNNAKTVISKLTTAIVGPRFSGKSTFLALYLCKVAERFTANGAWKRSFFFYLAFKDVANQLDDPIFLYQTFVNATFAQLEVQVPQLKQYAQKIAKFFNELPSNKATSQFPKRIPIDKEFPGANMKLTKIAERVRKIFGDPADFVGALKFIFDFPEIIGKVFEFTDVYYVLDDFDYCDVDVHSKPPFDVKAESLLLIDFLKESLKTKSFVLCCLDEPHFLEVLKSINDNSTEMRTRVVFANIADIEVEPPESHFEFMIEFENCHKKVRINRETCQGCIGFLVCWDKLVSLGVAVENNLQLQSKIAARFKQAIDKTNEDYRFLDFARKYLPCMLGSENNGKIADVKLINSTA